VKRKGRLIIIGGREEKWDVRARSIVQEVARAARRTKIVVVTAATRLPEELWKDYHKLFRNELGVRNVELLDIRTRADAFDEKNIAKLSDGAVVFFTGGDQLRIASQIGGTPVYHRIRDVYRKGGTICGTSAGAAAMPETMIVSGTSDSSGRHADLDMAPGLGLAWGVIVDSHFAERGRMGRLLSGVAHNPKNVGLGIDEDTAIILEQGSSNPAGRNDGVNTIDSTFQVIGNGAVYVVDGGRIDYSSLSEQRSDRVVTLCNVTLHVLGDGDRFDLARRVAIPHLSEDERRSLKASSNGRIKQDETPLTARATLKEAPPVTTKPNGTRKNGPRVVAKNPLRGRHSSSHGSA
jgi:cyanophycinase